MNTPRDHSEYAAHMGWRSKHIRTEAAHSNAFLFGVISDRMMTADRAWALPYSLADRLGHFDMRKIAEMSPDQLERVLRSPTNLHRFPPQMAKNYIAATKHLLTRRGGVAANMWPNGVQAKPLLEELDALPGISHKLSAMTLQMLVTCIGRDVRGLDAVDVAVDRHVARVFLRTGLVAGEPGVRVYRAAQLKPQVIEAARRALPAFPGALDGGAFEVGRRHCHHTQPDCRGCPLRNVCPRDRRAWAVGVVNGGKLSAE